MSDSFSQSSQEGYDQHRQGGGGKRMKKRGASEYITKEHGSFDNRDAAPDPPKMSTAAQLARRKIATPKSRAGRSTTPTMPSNPFQSQPQQQQPSSFGFGSNATASFPPQNQQSQSFQFSIPGASSSFTFGQTENNQPQPVSNPFANMNGTNGGFGSTQIDNTEMNDSSDPQPVQPPSSSVFSFGASQPAASTNTNGFSFGQPASQQSNGGFGGGSGLFGQQSTQSQNNNTGLFGQSFQTQQNGFTPSFGQNKEPSPSFAPATSSTPPPFSGFGTTSSSAPTNTFGSGQASTNRASPSPLEEPATTSNSLFNFGTPKAAASETPKKPSFSFGQPASSSDQSGPQSTSKPAFAGFGQPPMAQSPQTAITNASHGSNDSPKPFGSNMSQQGSSLFSSTQPPNDGSNATEKTVSDEGQKVKNPFSSLFAPSNEKSDTASKPAKTPFQFGQSTSFAPSTEKPAQTIESIEKPIASSPADTNNSSQSTGFNFGRSTNASVDLFSPKPATESSTSGLFNLNKPTPSAHTETTMSSNSSDNATPKPLFGFTPQKSADASSAAPKLFNFGSQTAASPSVNEQRDSSTQDGSPQKKRLFQGTSTPAAMAQSALSSFNSQPQKPVEANNTELENPQPKVSANAAISQPNVARAVSTEGPPQIPRFLSGDKYKIYDESWRLKALNRRFKDIIAGSDTEKHDLMNVIQNYLDHREAIGEGLGGYERKKSAGTKRKAIDVDDLQDETAQSKRTKPAETTAPVSDNNTTPSPAKPASLFSTSQPASFSSFTPSKTVADTQTSSIFKSMIPGASSNNNNGGFKPATTTFAPTKSTTPPSSPPKAAAPQLPKFEVPKFGGGGDFMSAFAKNSAANAKKFEETIKEKRKAEEFDSDEDDEEAWNKQYEEEQRAKKAKIEAAAKKSLAVPAFVPSASSSRSNSPFTFSQPIKSIETNGSKSPEPSSQQGIGASQSSAIEIESGESGEDSSGQESGNSGDDEADHAEDTDQRDEDEGEDEEEEEEEEEESEEIPNIPPEDSLFSRISGKSPSSKSDQPILQPAANNSFKPGLFFGNIGKGTPEQPTFSPFSPANTNSLPKGDFVPTTKFNFTPAPATSSGPVFGSSMLGGALKDGPIPGEGLFGSRPSTPSNIDAAKPNTGFSFGTSTSKQPVDNTFKVGSPIKFGSSTSAPAVEVTAATPPAKEQPKPFAGLFGQAPSSSSANGGSLGFNFGTPSFGTQPAPGYLSAAPHLGGVSGTSSRATSPGITSEAESVATDNTEDYSQEPQTSLMSSNSGEENEEIVYEARATISRMYKQNEIPEKSKIEPGWNKMGMGMVKVLKDKTSNKARIVFRAEPGANVILNTRLIAGGSYKSSAAGKGGAVTFPVATEGGVQLWMIRVKTVESAEEAAKAMEANKKN